VARIKVFPLLSWPCQMCLDDVELHTFEDIDTLPPVLVSQADAQSQRVRIVEPIMMKSQYQFAVRIHIIHTRSHAAAPCSRTGRSFQAQTSRSNGVKGVKCGTDRVDPIAGGAGDASLP
jgi:hypothetical protein